MSLQLPLLVLKITKHTKKRCCFYIMSAYMGSYMCNTTETSFVLLSHAVNSCLTHRPKSQCPRGIMTWGLKCGFRNVASYGQPLHRHCSVRAAERRLRGDSGRLTNPFPCVLSLEREILSVLILMPFTVPHDQPYFYSDQHRGGKKKKKKREVRCYRCRQLQKWEWPNRFNGRSTGSYT